MGSIFSPRVQNTLCIGTGVLCTWERSSTKVAQRDWRVQSFCWPQFRKQKLLISVHSPRRVPIVGEIRGVASSLGVWWWWPVVRPFSLVEISRKFEIRIEIWPCRGFSTRMNPRIPMRSNRDEGSKRINDIGTRPPPPRKYMMWGNFAGNAVRNQHVCREWILYPPSDSSGSSGRSSLRRSDFDPQWSAFQPTRSFVAAVLWLFIVDWAGFHSFGVRVTFTLDDLATPQSNFSDGSKYCLKIGLWDKKTALHDRFP